MEVKKISEEVTYKQITTQHTFEVNGKTVKTYAWTLYDASLEDYDDNFEIDKVDGEKLTDLEFEALGENLRELIELKDGESEQVLEEVE